jgi:hypothetical protein
MAASIGYRRQCKQPVFYGDVAKRQGKGLQNPDQGFKSPRRLFLFKSTA